jgi:hypothetical protein
MPPADDGEEPRKFAALQVRAWRQGGTLMRTSRGYVLVYGTHSHHSSDLNAIAAGMRGGGG